MTPGGCWELRCAHSLWFLTLKLGIGFPIRAKQGLVSNIGVLDCNIPFLKLHPPFSELSFTVETCVSSFYVDEGNAFFLLPERNIGKVLAFL